MLSKDLILRTANPKNVNFRTYNTFRNLKLITGKNVDIFYITETKIDETFPTIEFKRPSF